MKKKYLILGAGPAGLTVANKLKEKGETDFLLVEKEKEVGGLCRSEKVDGSDLDIGGGHILDVRRPEVNEFLFGFMPKEEWNIFNRDSKIHYKNSYLDHPFESNIWQMELEDQLDFIESISKAGCVKGEPKPEKFVDWINWKLGEKVTEEYMLPYNQKMFGENLDQLGTYWLEKLPDVSFRETLQSCLEHKPYGKEPGHAQFYYPKEYGYGELWLRMGKAVEENLLLDTTVSLLDVENKIVEMSDGTKVEFEALVTTIPWTCFEIEGADDTIAEKISTLKHTSVDIEYFGEELDTTSHWIYEPNPELSYHRILVRPNFFPGSKGYWTETNSDRIHLKKREGSYHYLNEYAYPLNTIGKNETMSELLSYMKERSVIGLGRWGEWQHYNSDVTVKLAMELSEKI